MAERCVLFCHVHTPGAPPGLREQKGLAGFPSVAWLDDEGRVLVKVPYDQRTVDGLRQSLARAERYVELRHSAARGDEDARAAFLLMQLEEAQLSRADAGRRRAGLAAAPERAAVLAAIDALLVDLDVSEQVRAAGQAGRHELGPRFLAMLEHGPRPSARVSNGFWYAILEWAERQRDAAAFRKGLDAFRAALAESAPDAAWVPPLLARYEAKLDELERSR